MSKPNGDAEGESVDDRLTNLESTVRDQNVQIHLLHVEMSAMMDMIKGQQMTTNGAVDAHRAANQRGDHFENRTRIEALTG